MRPPPGPTADPSSGPGPARRGLGGRFLRFAAVGASGFAVNAALLWALVAQAGWDPRLAAPLSIEAALLWNFGLNRAWTWRDRRGGWTGLASYHAVNLVGAGIQYAVLWAAVQSGGHYLAGSAVGVAAATGWNFVGNHLWTFRRTAARAPAQSASRRGLHYLASFAVLLVLAAVLSHPWDSFVFQRSTADFVQDGTSPYATAAEAPAYIFPGSEVPLQQQWYAYPPLPLLLMALSYLPAAGGAAPFVVRVLVKLPFLLGTLAFAWASHRVVATAPEGGPAANRAAAARLERWLLWNPLFLVVASVWGQFEALMLALLSLMVLALRRDRFAAAGLAWGGALLLKLLAVYLAPLLLLWLARRGGRWAPFRFFASGGLLFAAMSIPFWLAEPGGFWQQLVGMHAGRAPARFSPFATLYHGVAWLHEAFGVPLDAAALIGPLSILSFLVTGLVVLGLAVASLRDRADEAALLHWSALTLVGGLLATKVLNEQYALLPVGLLALASAHPTARLRWPGAGRFARVAAAAMAFAAVVDNFHFIRFVAPEVAAALWGQPAPALITELAWRVGLPVAVVRDALGIVTGLPLVAVLVWAVRRVAPEVASGLATLARALAPRAAVRRAERNAGLAVLLLLVAGPAAVALLAAPASGGPARETGAPAILADYRTDWFNPTSDPGQRAGTWEAAVLTPAAGYYNLYARRAWDDIGQMRQAGLDGVVIRYDPFFPSGAQAARNVAEDRSFRYAVAVDLGDLSSGGRIPLSDATASGASWLLGGPEPGAWGSPSHLLGPNGKPVLLVSGAGRLGYAFTAEELAYVAGFLETPAALGDVPSHAADLARPRPTAADWSQAYGRAFAAWWGRAGSQRYDILAEDGPAPGLDAIPWSTAVVGRDGPLDPANFGTAWVEAAMAQPDAALVPWNDFAAGRAVAPTLEHGDRLLGEAPGWVAWFRDHRAGTSDWQVPPEAAGGPTKALPTLAPLPGPDPSLTRRAGAA